MMNVALTMTRDERDAVSAFLGPAGRGGPPAAAFCSDRTSRSPPHASAPGTAGARRATTRASCRRPRRADRRAGPAPEAEMGVRLRRRHLGVRAATVIDDQIFVGSAGGVVHALRADTRLPAVDVPGQRPDPLRRRRRAGRRPPRAAVRRPDRLVLRARRREREAALEEAVRETRGRPAERAAASVHDGLVVVPVASWEESRAAQSRLSLLHVPRQHHRAADPRRHEAWKTLHGPRRGAARPARPPAARRRFGRPASASGRRRRST